MIPVLYSATVWLEWQYDYSATVPSQFYGAKVLRLQFYGPNVRVPDTTEPRTWLIRQSASLLPPFAAVMSPSPPREMDTILPLSYFLWSQVITKYQHLISLSCFVLRISPFPTRPVPVTPLLLLHQSLISPSPTSWFQSSLLLLLLPQLLAERKRLSDQFYYNYYREKFKVS